jgi:hypothetical protein
MGLETTAEKYSEAALPTYAPMTWYASQMLILLNFLAIFFPNFFLVVQRTWKEIKAVIPAELFVRDTLRGLLYVARDILLAAGAWSIAMNIDLVFKQRVMKEILTPVGAEAARWVSWGI